MNLSLFNLPEVKEFLAEHRHESPEKLAMKFHGKTTFPLAEVLLQLSLASKAEEKLPTWKAAGCVFTRQALEQATSEILALWKADTFRPTALVDLTAGLGVDAWAMGKALGSHSIILYESDAERADLLAWNFHQLGLKPNIFNQSATLSEIEHWPKDALVYIDPDRRMNGMRSLSVKDWSPDLSFWIPELLSRNRALLVKFSPMIDISWINQQLPGTKHVYVLGKERDVKEVLVHFQPAEPISLNFPRTAVLFQNNQITEFQHQDQAISTLTIKDPQAGMWLFDPHGVITKAGLVNEIAQKFNLSRVSRNSSYLLGNCAFPDFPGRQFYLLSVMEYKPDQFKQYLVNNHIQGAGIGCKDFPDTPEGLKKRFKLGESQKHYFAFTRFANGHLLVAHGQAEN